ncbi:hypothetical protein E1A91_A11G120700v1 [Gossypium mustelinum]|uniref:Transmembrane protein n=2 Tax=Gossypium TaxID=3633 RepID=A0A5D2X5N1_GOSMU|nr:hypothetical protein ES332_A11G124000v1 [Gossypium tomentosum]TYJ09144.1 hypothetical protein E1A91_A11G120700v1 [Gossypium mustelinum]
MDLYLFSFVTQRGELYRSLQFGIGKMWNCKNLYQTLTLKESFHLLTLNLLSLLLPLSFLLLARLSCVNYILTTTASNPSHFSPPFLLSFYLYTSPAVVVSVVSIAALFHGLTGKITLASDSPDAVYRPSLLVAWIVLCIMQVSIGLGIEGSIAWGIEGGGFGIERSLLSRIIFFLGLHEITFLWFRTVVKPVVDDTIFGAATPEKWIQRAAIALSVGTLWWWKLRDDVESLVVVAEAKKQLLMEIEMADFVGWWLYYLTATIGMVRVVKALLWLGILLLTKNTTAETSQGDQDKV